MMFIGLLVRAFVGALFDACCWRMVVIVVVGFSLLLSGFSLLLSGRRVWLWLFIQRLSFSVLSTPCENFVHSFAPPPPA